MMDNDTEIKTGKTKSSIGRQLFFLVLTVIAVLLIYSVFYMLKSEQKEMDPVEEAARAVNQRMIERRNSGEGVTDEQIENITNIMINRINSNRE